jgi:hypothetical protein
MMGAGGAVMLATLNAEAKGVQQYEPGDWAMVLDAFRGLRLPPRGKFPNRSMAEVARQFPKYIVYAYEKGSEHMGIPHDLYLICADAVVKSVPLYQVCKDIQLGRWRPDARVSAYRSNLVPRLHSFPDPTAERELPSHPNCRSMAAPVPIEPEEPSFLDQPAEQETENVSFLDGIF